MDANGVTAGFGQIAEACKSASIKVQEIGKSLENLSAIELSDVLSEAVNSVEDMGLKAQHSVQKTVDSINKQKAAYDKQVEKVNDLKNKFEELSKQKTATPALKELDTYIDKLEKKFGALITQQERFLATGGKEKNKTFKRMEYDIDELRNSIEAAKAEKKELISSGGAYKSVDTSAITSQLADAEAKLKTMQSGLQTSLEGLSVKLTDYANKAEKAAESDDKASSATSKMSKETDKASDSAKKYNDSFGKNIKTMLKYALGARTLFETFNKLKGAIAEGIKNLVQFDGETNKSVSNIKSAFTQLKNSTATAFAPLLNAAAPIITKFINLLSEATTKVGLFFAAITGQSSFTKAVAVQEDYAASLNNTAKAAKNADNYLSGLDQMSIYSDDSDSKDSFGGLSPNQMFETIEIPNSFKIFNEAMDKAMDKLKELGKMFSKGFKNGFKDNIKTLDKIKDNVYGIGSSLKEIFSDPSVVNSASNFVNSFMEMLGTLVGSVASIALAIVNNFTGALNDYLDKNKERVKEHLKKMFDIGTAINEMLSEAFASIGEILSNVINSDTAQKITEHIITIFSNIGMAVQEVIAGLFRDVINIITKPIIDNKKEIEQTILGILEPIETAFEALEEFANKVADGITEIYEDHIKPFTDDIADGVSNMVHTLLDAFNKYIKPVLDKLAERFKEIMNGPIGNAFNSFKEFVGEAIDAIHSLWNFLQPYFNWLIENIVQNIAPVIHFLGNVFLTVFEGIGKAVDGFFSTIKGVIKFIKDVFTGNWKELWNDVLDIFKGIWKKISAVIETPINLIIDGINFLIEKLCAGLNGLIGLLNNISFDVPDWVPGIGGEHFGFDISEKTPPSIPHFHMPYLAKGAVIPPNAPFAAVLGDQTKGYNIETPEALLRKIFREEISKNSGNNGENIYHIVVQLSNGSVLLDQMIREGELRKTATGRNPYALA